MPDAHGLTVQPAELTDSAARLEQLAEHLESVLKAESSHLSPAAVGRDEVSLRVATTLTEVQADYVTAATEGIAELRDIAAALRAGAGRAAGVDADFAL